MKNAFYLILSAILAACPLMVYAQTVTINPSVQRYIGDASQLNRPTYFTIHDASSDADAQTFLNDFNTYPGRGFWGPFSVARQETGSVGTYPSLQGGNGILKNVIRGIQTEHPYNAFVDGMDTKAAADWAADYYINRVTNPPEFFEPMNEPFVHAGEYGSDVPDIKRQMSELFRDIGNKFHNTPELANMQVIGYSAAWASLELWDFGHWDQNQKMFMDIAGADMDAFATHLYDGVNVQGQNTKRSGSNSDAILDLIETYSYTKWGMVKPHALTEYGAIETGYGDDYSDLASIQSVRSQNHLIFGLLEREDRMAISIPFNTGKALWHITEANNYQPYGAATWKPTNIGEPNPAGWVYTPRIEFYELWKNVRGNRVEIKTDNPDIQVQAFVDGAKLFVAVNNLDDHPQHVNLNILAELPGLQSVRIKTLKIYPDVPYVASDDTQSSAPSDMALIAGETAVLEYTFVENISFSNVLRSKNYYTSKHLQPITANTPISFTFDGVDTGTGYAKIKMTIGRKHNVSKTPIVTVNGITVPVPTNIKGYDQANRTDFFGTIDIPVSMELIKSNNTVTFTFPDNGGHLASVILNTEKYDNAVSQQVAFPGVTPVVFLALIEAENYDAGGEGIAYHDTDAVNTGEQYRPQNGVDISASTAAPYFVSSAVAGEWLEYTLQVPGDGEFLLQATVSSGDAAGSIRFEFDGDNKSGSVAIPATGVGTWTTIDQSVMLTGGRQVMRVFVESGNLNIDHFNFSSLVPVSGIAINADTLTTRVEKTAQLSAAVIPSYAAIQTFTWASANTAIAQVDANGLVTGVAVGETTIYAISDDGGYKDSARVIVQPKVIESVSFTEPVPNFIYSGENVTFKVDYVADSARDIAIELYNPERTQWLGLTRATVEEGTGTVELTIVPNSPLPPDTGYRLAASIRPVGTDWRQIIASENILFDVIEKENIDFVDLPEQMVTGGSLSFDISYIAHSERDVFVELYTPNRTQWLGAKKMTVPAGKDTVTLTINLSGSPAPAKYYDLGCALRPVGGDWTSTIVGKKALIELVTPGPQNLVNNPGFETGDFSGWWPQDKEIVTDDVFEGTYSAKITGGNVGQPIDVEPSATYDISIANKLLSGSQAGLVFQTIPGYKWLKTVNLNNAEWTETRSSITIPDTVSRINVFISGPTGNIVLVDNVTLIKKIPVTGISVSPTSLTLQMGEGSTLNATIFPEEATNKDIIWTSSHPSVATVDNQGFVTTIERGTTMIIATSAFDATVADTAIVDVWYQSPFNNLSVPGIIELEDYDEGGEGVAYHDTTPANSGNSYRDEGVDIEITNDQSGAYNVTDIDAGEWLEYEINVLADGDYYLYLRAAAATEGLLKLEIEALDIREELNIPAAGIDQWSMISLPNSLALTAGNYIMKLTSLGGEFRLNFVEVEAVSPECLAALYWDAGETYAQSGTEVLFEGKRYANKYYTKGDIPGESKVWELLGYCGASTLDCYNTAVWNAQTTYPTAGFQVIHHGSIYTSLWQASAGQEPGVSNAWQFEGPCTGSSLATPPSNCPDVAPWVTFATYSTAGTEVTHNGMLYANQWYASAGEEPGISIVWNPIAPCTPVYVMATCPPVAHWDIATVYSTPGTEVLHNGAVFKNKYYAPAGQEPGVAIVWEYQYSCNSTNARQALVSPDLTNEQDKVDLRIYPNPLDDGSLTIEVFTNTDYSITIFNMQGALMYKLSASPTEYHSAVTPDGKLEKGVYLVILQSGHGKVIRKLVVN